MDAVKLPVCLPLRLAKHKFEIRNGLDRVSHVHAQIGTSFG